MPALSEGLRQPECRQTGDGGSRYDRHASARRGGHAARIRGLGRDYYWGNAAGTVVSVAKSVDAFTESQLNRLRVSMKRPAFDLGAEHDDGDLAVGVRQAQQSCQAMHRTSR